MGEFSRVLRLPAALFAPSKPKVLFSTLPPPDPSEESDRGLVTIQGGSVGVISLSHSHSADSSKSVKKEQERVVDNVRCKNPDDPNQHVDVQRPVKIKISPTQTNIRAGGTEITIYADQPPQENVEVLEENIEQRNPDY